MYAHPHAAAAYDLIHSCRGKDYRGEAETVLDHVRRHCADATSLLDVACGTGLHLVEFARLGLDVAGVEPSSAMLDAARCRLPDVPVDERDMRAFDLGRTFDAVVCLFSAIGYMTNVADLEVAIAQMAAHLAPGGVLVVEPWFAPDNWVVGTLHADNGRSEELAVARVNRAGRDGAVSTIDVLYVVATAEASVAFPEHHRMGLFTLDQYTGAFEAAGLQVEHDQHGLTGRGLYIGVKAAGQAC